MAIETVERAPPFSVSASGPSGKDEYRSTTSSSYFCTVHTVDHRSTKSRNMSKLLERDLAISG